MTTNTDDSKNAIHFCKKCQNLYDITNNKPTVENEEMKGNNSSIYYVCNVCGYYEVLKPGSLVCIKKSLNKTKEYFNNVLKPEVIVQLPILPHTRNYTCPNTKCETHAKPQLKDAVMTRITTNSYTMMYVCCKCLTQWNYSR